MLLVFDTTFLNIKEVHSLMIVTKHNETKTYPKKIWYKPSTWSPQPKISKKTTYVLTLEYLASDNINHRFTSESADYSCVKKQAEEILSQIKMQTEITNREMIDKLFEDAIMEA